jgi:rod shape-determining protein MreD
MILTPKILARLVAIVVIGVLLQLSFFSQVALFHTSPDVLPALVASLGLLGGTMTGAVTGFSVGFLLDCLLIAPLGGGSLVLLSTGYLAGLFRERFEIRSPLVPPLLCMVLTLFAELGFGAVELMLGGQTNISSLVIRDVLLKSVFAFFLGWPIYLGLKRLLRPALVEEGAVRRRPRPTVLGASAPCTCVPTTAPAPATAWRCGSPCSVASRSPSSRCSSSGSGTCRSSPASSTWRRRTTTAPASTR